MKTKQRGPIPLHLGDLARAVNLTVKRCQRKGDQRGAD